MEEYMKRLFSSTLALVAILALSSCGGGSSDPIANTDVLDNNQPISETSTEMPTSEIPASETTEAVTTGIGYYVDSPISGVAYQCGTQSGMTGEDGSFVFDIGSGCTFSLAGVTLRETQANEHQNGGEVIENNSEVARFLQSIDFDGDASNGIEIKQEIMDTLNVALSENGNKIPATDSELETVVAHIQAKIANFNGHVKTNEEAQEHLNDSQTKITQELLANKTLYMVLDTHIEANTFNSELTQGKWENVYGSQLGNKGEVDISVNGNQLFFGDGGNSVTVIGDDEKGVFFLDNQSLETLYLYYNFADAKELFDSKNPASQEPDILEPTTQPTTQPTNTPTYTYSDHIYYTGPRGGCYYWNSNGNKTYVENFYCN